MEPPSQENAAVGVAIANRIADQITVRMKQIQSHLLGGGETGAISIRVNFRRGDRDGESAVVADIEYGTSGGAEEAINLTPYPGSGELIPMDAQAPQAPAPPPPPPPPPPSYEAPTQAYPGAQQHAAPGPMMPRAQLPLPNRIADQLEPPPTIPGLTGQMVAQAPAGSIVTAPNPATAPAAPAAPVLQRQPRPLMPDENQQGYGRIS